VKIHFALGFWMFYNDNAMTQKQNQFYSISAKLGRMILIFIVIFFSFVGFSLLFGGAAVLNSNLKSIESNYEKSIREKGLLLVGNNSLALGGLAADLAFTSVEELVRLSVEQDKEVVFGFYSDDAGRVWTYAGSAMFNPQLKNEDRQIPSEWYAQLKGAEFRRRSDSIYEFAAPVHFAGEKLGTIHYGFTKEYVYREIMLAKESQLRAGLLFLALFMIFFALMGLVGYIFTRRYARKLVKPIEQLTQAAKQIEARNYHQPIVVHSNDEVGQLAINFERMRQTVCQYTEHLGDLVDKRTRELSVTMNSLYHLLNNADQGFLTFGEDMITDAVYSLECIQLLGGRIHGRHFPELLFPRDHENREYLEDAIRTIFKESQDDKIQMFLELLPDETIINNRIIRISYKLLNKNSDTQFDQKIMAILTDVTEQRDMQTQIKKEENTLRMLLHFINNQELFKETINEYIAFTRTDVFEILSSGRPIPAIIYDLYRRVHSFKGLFGQLEMDKPAERLNELENKLSEAVKNPRGLTKEDLAKIVSVRTMEEWVQNCVEDLKKLLGEKYEVFNNGFFVRESVFQSIKDDLNTFLREQDAEIALALLDQMRFKPVQLLLQDYVRYVNSLAEKHNRFILPLIINAEPIMVNSDMYRAFASSLTQVFRNCVAHGLEEPEERKRLGKPESGKIECQVSRVRKDRVQIKICDDGRGIQVEKIKQKAIANGWVREETAHLISDEDWIKYIFRDGMSSADDVSMLRGRGVGLSLVKHEVERLGGVCTVESSPGFGTTFTFEIPLKRWPRYRKLGVNSLVRNIREYFQKHLSEQYHIPLEIQDRVLYDEVDRITVEDHIAFVELQGCTKALVGVSFPEELCVELLKNFPKMNSNDLVLRRDILREILNVCIGNVAGELEKSNYIFFMKESFFLYKGQSYVEHRGHPKYISRMQSPFGIVSFIFIQLE
jgi:signal transduction histidine kinase